MPPKQPRPTKMLLTVLKLSFILMQPASAIRLETLIEDGKLGETLRGKTIGFYTGSFDPLHLGHQGVALTVLKHKLCDYVLIYPAWGGDEYKNRIDVSLRLEMIDAALGDHPQIIVTKLPPAQLQSVLTINIEESDEKNWKEKFVKPAFDGAHFIAIVGSDTAMSIKGNPKYSGIFMRGIKIPPKHAEDTIGGLMVAPADAFIVAARDGENLSEITEKIDDRRVVTIIKAEGASDQSSTAVKKALREGTSIIPMVGGKVGAIIEAHKLYTHLK